MRSVTYLCRWRCGVGPISWWGWCGIEDQRFCAGWYWSGALGVPGLV